MDMATFFVPDVTGLSKTTAFESSTDLSKQTFNPGLLELASDIVMVIAYRFVPVGLDYFRESNRGFSSLCPI